MPSESSSAPARDWRNRRSLKSPADQSQDDFAWRSAPAAAPRPRGHLSRQAKIGMGLTAFLLLTGLLFWISFWLRPPKTACLVLVGAGYQENLLVPHNVYGWQGVQGLAELSRDKNTSFLWGNEMLRLHQEPLDYHSGDVWADRLSEYPEKTIVVYFSLHGGTDAKGPYLLPGDATAQPTERNRLRLTTILETLSNDKLKDKSKLLILDATQVAADWQLGILNNDFTRQLKAMEPEIVKVPNLVVLNATDVGQTSWINRYWRRTVFTHHVIEGLRGAAVDKNNNGRISAWELYEYVRPAVERTVRDTRDADQTPILLPQGPEGEARAAHMNLTVVRNYEPSPTATNLEELPPEVEEVWATYGRLATMNPAPPDYDPLSWRRYRDLLLRYEALVWAGDGEAASRVSSEMMTLEQDLVRKQKIELTSLQNTLAMPAAAGVTIPPVSERFTDFKRIWDAKPDEFGRRWAELLTALKIQGRRPTQILRLQFYEFLLLRVDQGQPDDLATAARLIRAVDDPLNPRPAEIHYLAMLERDRPRTAEPQYFVLVQQAIKLRVVAEQAALGIKAGRYSYSQDVFPWIQDLIGKADHERQLGQDLLFASDVANWRLAGERLAKADGLYHQAEARADVVRNALAVRNRIAEWLPYYSQWLARVPVQRANQSRTMAADRMPKIEAVWADVHYLDELLAAHKPEWLETPPPPDADHPKPVSVKAMVQALDATEDELAKEFLQYCRYLSNVETQSVWRDAEDALVVPIRNFALRQRLHTTMWRTSRRLIRESQEGITRRTAVAEPVAASLDLQVDRGRRQGRLALAVLGQRWFNQCPSPHPQPETFVQVLHQLDVSVGDPRWWDLLNKAGEEVGTRWQSLPAAIHDRTRQARRGDLEAAQREFQVAARLARMIDGAEIDPELLRTNASDLDRRARMLSLLIGQSNRTFTDHWFSEDPQAHAYYVIAGTRFLDDAQQLDFRSGTSADVQRARDMLKQPGALVFHGPPSLQLTTEQRFDVAYRLAAAKDAVVPEGFPVAWLEVGPGLKAVPDVGASRQVRRYGGKDAPDPIAYALTSPPLDAVETNPPKAPTVEPTGITLQGRYRGQQIVQQTPVNLFLLPDNVRTVLPSMRLGSVSVRAPGDVQQRFGAGNGAIAIVLDCSGSMGAPPGETFGKNTKYFEATQALRRTLRKVPRGTRVSLWVFGQALENQGRTVEDAERTITQILKPVAWDADTMLAPVMKNVEYPAMVPWNESPIVRAMLYARDDLRKATGFKTLLVITDGMDNRFEQDRRFNPEKLAIPAFLRRTFADSGIMVNVVGFKVVDEEEKKAQAQFAVIEDLPIPGKFYTVRETALLDGILEQALRQKLHYWIDNAENVSVTGRDGLDVSRIGENAQWFQSGLPPAIYKVRVRTDRRLEKDVTLAGGDLLLVDLVAAGSELLFERGLYSEADFPQKPFAQQQGWRMAVLQNQQQAGQAVQMLVTLEKTTDRRETILQRLRPRFTWIEITPRSEYQARMKNPRADVCAHAVPYCQRWEYRPGYPAPAWSIDAPWWPGLAGVQGVAASPDPPIVQLWWNPDQEIPFATVLDRGNDFSTIQEIVNRKLQVDGDPITVESVRVEDHWVETRPGQPRELRPCLVVRIKHAECKPVWVQVQGLKPSGEEHRSYAEAARYTGIFWPVDPNAVNNTLSRIGVSSLAAFKRRAEERRYSLTFTELGAPTADDVRPPVPVTLP